MGSEMCIRDRSIADGGEINAGINPNGIGNGGDIFINATESISVDGTGILNDVSIASEISSDILRGGVGDTGNLTVNTPQLSVSDSAYISADVFGTGNSSNIKINTEQLSVSDSAYISADIGGMGNSGNICLLYTSPSPRDLSTSRMPSSA